jgi:hypothetical protein
MRRILILRYPNNTSPERVKESWEATQRIIGNDYVVLPFITEVEKIEVEIVYDPNPKTDQVGMDQERLRQFIQFDTLKGLYMGGKP